MAVRKVYWDTSCFISYLSSTHPEEQARAQICEDVLNHARNDEIEIWTSVWTIVETLRPKAIPKSSPLPEWAALLDGKDQKGELLYPKATQELEAIWKLYKHQTRPSRLLSAEESKRITEMFSWSWIRKIHLGPGIASKAVEIQRLHKMKAGDSVHVASAMARGCEVIHCWDRDYEKTSSLIPAAAPERLSLQNPLPLQNGTPEGP
jgi:predicted nucleic acid-binding protein